MDPLSHALTGALCARLAASKQDARAALSIGALAGLAPDLDAFIRSETDPLVYLEYHRQFTHSLAFAPALALVCAALAWFFLRGKAAFGRIWLFALLGIVPHGLLDACTSYGTVLWWPFSDARVSWNLVAIIDPLYTAPLLGLFAAAFWRPGRRALAVWGVGWAVAYLAIGAMQLGRAERALEEIALERGHVPERLEAKPVVFTNFLFRGLYEAGRRYYVDAVRVGWLSRPRMYAGGSARAPEDSELFAGLEPDDEAYRAVERFKFFSQGFVYQVDGDPDVLGDLRYSMLPDSLEPLWRIEIDRERPDRHAQYVVRRDVGEDRRERFKRMVLGRDRF